MSQGSNKSEAENDNQGDVHEIYLVIDATPMASNLLGLPEALLSSSSASSPPIAEWKQQLENNKAPRLTSVRRARLEKEITLLEQLAHGNEAATALSNLWIHERGPSAARALQIAQGLVQRGAWQQAEHVLTLMIQEEGVHFLAPLSQLAQLYALQGRLAEAKQLHEMVLSQKPWYLSSLLGIHDVCKRIDDHKELIKWDRELIPFMEKRARREAWVQRMVAKAKDMLNQFEQELKGYFDEFYNSHGSEGSVLVGDENSWQ